MPSERGPRAPLDLSVLYPAPKVRFDVTIVGPATGPNSVWPTVIVVGAGLVVIGLIGRTLLG